MDNYIGINVAKSTLQVFISNNEMDIGIDNNLEGVKNSTSN